MPRITVKFRILDNGSPRNFDTRLTWLKAENLLSNFFLPTSKNSAGYNSTLRQIIEDRRQSEARNVSSSTVNALRKGTKLGP